jgi:hypothetical protein
MISKFLFIYNYKISTNKDNDDDDDHEDDDNNNNNNNNNNVTCQPFVGSRNRALLGSRQQNASRLNTRSAAVGEAVFAPCRAVPSRTAPSAATQQAAMTSHMLTWLPGAEPPSCQTARGVGDVT